MKIQWQYVHGLWIGLCTGVMLGLNLGYQYGSLLLNNASMMVVYGVWTLLAVVLPTLILLIIKITKEKLW